MGRRLYAGWANGQPLLRVGDDGHSPRQRPYFERHLPYQGRLNSGHVARARLGCGRGRHRDAHIAARGRPVLRGRPGDRGPDCSCKRTRARERGRKGWWEGPRQSRGAIAATSTNSCDSEYTAPQPKHCVGSPDGPPAGSATTQRPSPIGCTVWKPLRCAAFPQLHLSRSALSTAHRVSLAGTSWA